MLMIHKRWQPRGNSKLAAGLVVLAMPFLSVVGVSAVASTYYVNNTVSCSDSGSGSSTIPFCTISKAASVATAGSTVQVVAGTYQGPVSPANSGTSLAPITFNAAPGVTVHSSTYGFRISSKSWINVSGFTISNTTNDGIYASSATGLTLSGNSVSVAGFPVSGQIARGIKLASVTTSTVASNTTFNNTDAGIYLDATTNGVTLSGNTSYGNARQYTRAAPGIDVRGYNNTVVKNITRNNEDSGLQFYTGSHNNLVANNLTYSNGDHGIDDLGSSNQTIVGNTVYKNVAAGINLEGTSPNAIVENNISMDNGIASPRTSSNIRVDSTSTSGTVVNFNLVWLTSPSAYYVWGSTTYNSLAAFQSATGQEAHGLQADPQFANITTGDFRLQATSPAIDSADSGVAGEQLTDILGNVRSDDLSVADTGIGPRTYDDRGAYEF